MSDPRDDAPTPSGGVPGGEPREEPFILHQDGSIAETTCPKCGASQLVQNPRTGGWTCLFCHTEFAATMTEVVTIGDEDAARGADVADGRVYACPNCGSTELRQDGYTGKWHCLSCRNEFLDTEARMVVVDAGAAIAKNDLVIDTADLLDPEQEQELVAYFQSVKQTIVFAVETVNTITENVEYYARRRAQELGVGRDDIDNGVYIVVVMQPRRIQLQTGDGVAPKVSPADLNRIASTVMKPRFQQRDFVAGIREGAAAVLAQFLGQGPKRMPRWAKTLIGVGVAAAVVVGGWFGIDLAAKQPYHAFTVLSASGECTDHLYEYDSTAGGHQITARTVVDMGQCESVASNTVCSGTSGTRIDTYYRSIDWVDVSIGSASIAVSCSVDAGGGGWDGGGGGGWDGGGGGDFGGGDFGGGGGGGSDW